MEYKGGIMEKQYIEGIKYPLREKDNICSWWLNHQEYDVNEYPDHVEIKLRPNWENEKLNRIREEREKICFTVVNRGSLWYSRLTETQKEELNAWYQAWLDAPQTGVKPQTPTWI